MARVLIAGCGYVGTALAELLAADSHEVWGLRRRPTRMPAGVQAVAADLGVAATLRAIPPDLDFVFYTAAPAGSEDLLYRATYVDGLHTLLEALDWQKQKPRRVVFTSSTGVYAQQDGEWVDETSPCEPSHFSGVRLLQAERILVEGPFPTTVVRFGGIYGPRRTRLIERVRTGNARWRPGRYTNRIHRDDCAGVLRHLVGLEPPEGLYLGVDSEPAEERVVLQWLAGTLGAPPPRPEEEGGEGDGRGSRGNKRCRNARLLDSGYAFRYPTFREGYGAVIRELP